LKLGTQKTLALAQKNRITKVDPVIFSSHHNMSDGSIKTRIFNRDESPLAGLRSIKRALTGGNSHLKVIEDRLRRFNERSYGVLYKSAYQPL